MSTSLPGGNSGTSKCTKAWRLDEAVLRTHLEVCPLPHPQVPPTPRSGPQKGSKTGTVPQAVLGTNSSTFISEKEVLFPLVHSRYFTLFLGPRAPGQGLVPGRASGWGSLCSIWWGVGTSMGASGFASTTQNCTILPGPQCPHWAPRRGQGWWSEGPREIQYLTRPKIF